MAAFIDSQLNQCHAYNAQAKRRIKDEVSRLCTDLQSLQPRVNTLVQNNGRSLQLLQLFGTVPMYYKHARYQIPVVIWITAGYPNTPPEVYVTPTQDMRIKDRHKHVDMQGKVYLPYLHSWKYTCNIEELVNFMASSFGDDPPVYSVGSQQQNAQRPANNDFPAYDASAFGADVKRNNVVANKAMSPGSAAAARKDRLVQRVTEKLKTSLKQFNEETAKDIDSIMTSGQSVRDGATKIQEGIDALTTEKNSNTQAIAALDTATTRLETWLATNESKEIDANAVVEPVDKWSQQLLDAVARDNAVSDALYILDKALREDRIDLPTFLKQVRKLARKQFMARALAMKINKKMRGQ